MNAITCVWHWTHLPSEMLVLQRYCRAWELHEFTRNYWFKILTLDCLHCVYMYIRDLSIYICDFYLSVKPSKILNMVDNACWKFSVFSLKVRWIFSTYWWWFCEKSLFLFVDMLCIKIGCIFVSFSVWKNSGLHVVQIRWCKKVLDWNSSWHEFFLINFSWMKSK